MAGNTVYSPDGSEWTREFISPLWSITQYTRNENLQLPDEYFKNKYLNCKSL
jgi:hypothetical protein